MTNNGDTTPEGQPGPYGAPDPNQPGATPPSYGAPQYGAPQYGDPYGQTSAGAGGAYGGGGYGTGGGYGPQPFDVGAAIKWGWTKFTQNVGQILAFVIIFVIASIVAGFIGGLIGGAISGSGGQFTFDAETGEFTNASLFTGSSILGSLVQNFIAGIVSMIGQALFVKGALDITHGRQFSLGNLSDGLDWVQILIASLILSVATSIGYALCFLPGVVIAFLTWFTFYFVIDKKMPAIDAIKASFTLVKDNLGSCLILAVLCFLIAMAGFIACCVGLLVAIPVIVLSNAYAYRTLQGEPVAP